MEMTGSALLSAAVVLVLGGGLLLAALSRFVIEKRNAQQAALEQLTRSEANLAHAQALANFGSWEWRPGQPDYWSGQMYRILGLDPRQAVPGFPAILALVVAEDRPQFLAAVRALSQNGGKHAIELRIRRPDGEKRVLCDRSEVLLGGDARPAIARGTLQDITESKQMEGRIRALAYYDSLTGLANRMRFKELVGRALQRAEHGRGRVAVMFLDLDRFKQINDSLGHSVGDELLKAVADRLSSCVRSHDHIGRAAEEHHTMARLGGDEFTVMLTGFARAEDAGRVAQRIVTQMARPFAVAGHELFVSASVGIAVYPEDGADVDTLLQNADVAMYYAKDHGRNNSKFYSSELNARALERLTLERDLHRALERGEFMLLYQPQADAASGRVTGVEALLRWRHPERGVLAPGQFIPLAEQNGLIAPIGAWVLREACRQAQAWVAEGRTPLEMWVNVSGVQFRDGRLAGAVREALAASGFDSRLLVLEATETIMMENRETTFGTLLELKELGVGIALDDFGTGYSSLAYLKRFPLDALKIDGSFVRDLPSDADDQAIVSAIIALARNLKLRVLAEGVETPEQAARLLEMGCTRMQGYLFGRPVPAAEIAPLAALLAQSAAGRPAGKAPRLKSIR